MKRFAIFPQISLAKSQWTHNLNGKYLRRLLYTWVLLRCGISNERSASSEFNEAS